MTCNDANRSPYDVYARLEDPLGVLAVALAHWGARDDARPQPEVRQAANTAMDAIDTMLAELHQMRARLVGEIRQADDATAARVDAMLTVRPAPCRMGPADLLESSSPASGRTCHSQAPTR
jgi:hypothetical protein